MAATRRRRGMTLSSPERSVGVVAGGMGMEGASPVGMALGATVVGVGVQVTVTVVWAGAALLRIMAQLGLLAAGAGPTVMWTAQRGVRGRGLCKPLLPVTGAGVARATLTPL